VLSMFVQVMPPLWLEDKHVLVSANLMCASGNTAVPFERFKSRVQACFREIILIRTGLQWELPRWRSVVSLVRMFVLSCTLLHPGLVLSVTGKCVKSRQLVVSLLDVSRWLASLDTESVLRRFISPSIWMCLFRICHSIGRVSIRFLLSMPMVVQSLAAMSSTSLSWI